MLVFVVLAWDQHCRGSPDPSEWKEYYRHTMTMALNGEPTVTEAVGTYWSGIVTTVENAAYGLKGGFKAHLAGGPFAPVARARHALPASAGPS